MNGWRKAHPEYQKKWDTYNYERREKTEGYKRLSE
jgi:hypothetical protein